MKKVAFLSVLVGIIMLFALNVNAATIQGIATDNNGFIEVGTPVTLPDGSKKYEYFIPLGEDTATQVSPAPAVNSDGVYGVDDGGNYGTFSDSIQLFEDEQIGDPTGGPTIDIYYHFHIDSGLQGTSITIWDDDRDMAQSNDPAGPDWGFFEDITLYGQWGMPTGVFTSWQGLESQPDVSLNPSTIPTNFGNEIDGVGITFSNLVIPEGDVWLRVSSSAYSIGFDAGDGRTKTWRNTVELTSASMEVVPEPTTIALLGMGLAGLAGVGARRKWKKKAVDKS